MNIFKVVTEEDQETFIAKCTKLLDSGYTPLGGVSTSLDSCGIITYTLGFTKK